jgi:hypothetical protein
MSWEALSPRRLSALLASLNRQHSALQRTLRALERTGLSPSDDPLYRSIEEAADSIADARFLLRTKLRRANGGGR